MSKTKHSIKRNWDNAFVNFFITLCVLGGATLLCALIHNDDRTGTIPAIMIFILAILIIARTTDGYLWGIIASCVGVIVVNFIFTYPFFELNFSLTGYPITFITMLVVSMITSATSTQIKQNEELKIQAEGERIRANLLRAISHDIRTPLTSIVGATSVMLNDNGKLTEETRLQLLTDINQDADWLIRVTENILSITRVEGDTTIATKPELAEELIETSIRKFHKHHPDSIPVEVSLPEQPLMVSMDIILMEQVLSNILENAVTHGKGASVIKVDLAEIDGQAVFSIMNDGAPIPHERISELFAADVRPDNDAKAGEKRCMGIGLAVCRTIVDAHGGRIWARNLKNDKGVIFYFSLPIMEMEIINED